MNSIDKNAIFEFDNDGNELLRKTLDHFVSGGTMLSGKDESNQVKKARADLQNCLRSACF